MKPVFYCTIIIMLIAGSCTDDAGTRIKKNLNIILQDDLETIVSDIEKENLADSVYYDIVSYQEYDEGKYLKKAVADFYFLKGVKVKIVRKYRYDALRRKWDRYFNEYLFFHDEKE